MNTERKIKVEDCSVKLGRCAVVAGTAVAITLAAMHFNSRRVGEVELRTPTVNLIRETEATEAVVVRDELTLTKELVTEKTISVTLPPIHSEFEPEYEIQEPKGETIVEKSEDLTELKEPGRCELKAAYVRDITIQDGTILKPSTRFTKSWEVANIGNCRWPLDTVLERVSTSIEGENLIKVGEVLPGEIQNLSVGLASPKEEGNYQDIWQLATEKGPITGGKLTVVINVKEKKIFVPEPIASNFEFGVHIFDTSLPHIDLMHRSGMKWVKVQMHYGQEAYSFVEKAHNQGFKVLVGALGSKDLVTENNFETSFADWVRQLSESGVDGIEIWNEPNIEREWPWSALNGINYTSLLETCFNAVKSGDNPDTFVISAALANSGCWGEMGCGCTDFCGCGCNDDVFLKQMAESGAGNYIDFVGVHFNSGATSPLETSGHPGGNHPTWYFLPTMDFYYNTFGGQKQLAITEFGIVTSEGTCPSGLPSNFSWAKGNTLNEQSQWINEGINWANNSGKVRLSIIWNLDFARNDCGPGAGDPQRSFAIIRPDGSCPTCFVLSNN
jgi:hypothetical protein